MPQLRVGVEARGRGQGCVLGDGRACVGSAASATACVGCASAIGARRTYGPQFFASVLGVVHLPLQQALPDVQSDVVLQVVGEASHTVFEVEVQDLEVAPVQTVQAVQEEPADAA